MKYWVYINGEVPGSYEPVELARIPGFSASAMVCPAEGKDSDRNWQRAGLFPEIVTALQDRPESKPPDVAPVSAADFVASPLAPKDILDATSQRLFHHVTGLMRELENRREERALTQSLQRSLVEAKNELQAARERIRYLEDRASLIPGFEDREHKLREYLDNARADIKDRERRIDEIKADLEKTTRALTETAAEKESLSKLAEELGRHLTEKELALAKSMAILHRLEEEMRRILPQSMAGIGSEIPKWPEERPVSPRPGPPAAAPERERPSSSPQVPPEAPPPPAPSAAPPASGPAPVRPEPGPPESRTESASAPVEPRAETAPRHDKPLEPSSAPEASGARHEPPASDMEAALAAAMAARPPEKESSTGATTESPPPAPASKTRACAEQPFTQDEGKVEAPVPLPPEGVVAPVTPPWRVALSRFSALLKQYLPMGKPPRKDAPPPPKP